MQNPSDFFPSDHRQLLLDLKKSIEQWFLLRKDRDEESCLLPMLLAIKSVLINEFRKVNSIAKDETYAGFLNDLDWLGISTNARETSLHPHSDLPSLKLDTADCLLNWLYTNLKKFCLCDKLKVLIADVELLACYYRPVAFLRNEKYATALLICLSAIELNQSSLLSQIEAGLYSQPSLATEVPKHKRSSSHPHFSISPNKHTKSAMSMVADKSLPKSKSITDQMAPKSYKAGTGSTPKSPREGALKLRRCKSLPTIHSVVLRHRIRSQTISQSDPIEIPRRVRLTAENLAHNDHRNIPAFEYQSHPHDGSTSSGYNNTASTNKSGDLHDLVPITLVRCDDIKIYEDNRQKPKKLNESGMASSSNDSHIINYDSPSSSPKASPLNFLSCISANVFSPGMPLDLDNKPSGSKISSSVPSEFVTSFLTREGEKPRSRHSKAMFEEANETSVNESINRIPSTGQSLTSFLQTAQYSRNITDLERENAHFKISEAMICAIEHMKWTTLERKKQKFQRKRSVGSFRGKSRRSNRTLKEWEANISDTASKFPNRDCSASSNSHDDEFISSCSDASSGENECDDLLEKLSVSTQNINDHTAYAEWGENGLETLSAEGVALSLIAKFSDKQLPRASDISWLVSEEDAPQQLLPMPSSFSANPDDHVLHSFTRGTRDWAPPRPQVIFTPHPPPNRKKQILQQNNRCAGCGMRVSMNYINRFRYCTYLGKYLCTGCHRNQISTIPSKVLEKWDFTLYPVCGFSYRLLEQIWTYPLFYVPDLQPQLYLKIKNLHMARIKRSQLKFIQDFIISCRFAEQEKKLFDNIESHITTDLDKWAMCDFLAAKDRSIHKKLQEIISACEKHVYNCMLCTAHGFICELCSKDEIIYPWQPKVKRCDICGTCFHEKCYRDQSECVKCQRLRKRQEIRN